MGVGALNVGVIANTAKARKNLKSFRGEIGKSAKATSLASKSFKAMGSALAGIATVGFAKQALTSFRRAADDLAETSRAADRLGTSVAKLQALEYAGTRAGLGVDLVRDSMQELQLRASEAAQGTGSAAEAYQQLGINAKTFNQLSPERKLHRIADAMRGVRNASDRISLADQLFGGEGTRMLSMLDRGSAGLKSFTDEAKRLGLTTKGNLKDVRSFSDAAAKLDSALEGLNRELTITVAPAAVKYVESFTEGVRLIRDQQEAMRGGKGFVGSIKAAIEKGQNRFLADALREAGRQVTGGKKPGAESFSLGASSTSKIGRDAERSSSVGKSVRAFEQKRAILGGFREVGRELGRLSNDATAGRVLGAKASPRMIDEAPRGLNALIDANSREGYMALRANMRGGETVKHARETAAATKGADAKLSTLVSLTNRLLSFYENAPPPRGI